MTMIFSASTPLGTPEHSGPFLVPIIKWFKPDVTGAQLRILHLIFRKVCHLTEYAIFATLLWTALVRSYHHTSLKIWHWRYAAYVLLFAASYGITDEVHQLFVPGREGTLRDVIIDTIGAAIGLAILWFCFRNKTRQPSDAAPAVSSVK